jgi:alkaline phosphatase
MLFIRLLCCAFAVATASPLSAADRAIVLVIADGTSQELITAARIYAHGATGRLALESFPHTAIVRTHSREDAVTDSAAAATAMARGIKADNRAIGMEDPDSKSSPPSLLDLARKAGWSTGIVTDDTVTGATPACFLVEHPSRWEDAQIASKIADQLGARADIVLGGGAKWFADLTKQPGVEYKPGEREIVQATEAKLADARPDIYSQWKSFVDAAGEAGERPILGIFYPGGFPFYADGPRVPRVADMAREAVRFLRAKGRPFFLMVEAGLPDKASHRGQAKRAVTEVLELDHLLVELRKTLPPDSLILVTTDHNTGGLAINGSPVPITIQGDALMGANPTTGKSILSWASGPGGNLAESNVRTKEVPQPDGSVQTQKEPKKPSDPDFQQPAAIPAGAASHTGGDVWLLGEGPGSEKVHGFLNNTEIYRLILNQIKASGQ